MTTFFTIVKKSVKKEACFISRMLRVSLKNTESRAIFTPKIREINFSCSYPSLEKWKYSCGEIGSLSVVK